jgi:hypothetical protein
MYPSPNIIKTKKRNETVWICSTHETVWICSTHETVWICSTHEAVWICSTHEIDDKIVRFLEYVKANSYYKQTPIIST